MLGDGFTGIGRYCAEIIQIMAAEKPNFTFVLFTNSPTPPAIAKLGNVKSIRVNIAHYSLGEQTKLGKIMQKENCDLYHFPHFNVPLGFNKTGKFPFVVTIHDLTLGKYPPKGLKGKLKKYFYHKVISYGINKSEVILTVSYNTKKDVMKQFNTPESKIIVSHNGVSFMQSAENNKGENAEKSDEKYVFYSGNWKPHKNVPRLIHAFASTKKALDDENLRLKLTGKPSDDGLAVIEQLGIEKDVDLLGHVSEEDLEKYTKNAWVYAFFSLYEGFGLPPLEAMSLGVPVVAARRSAVPEVCDGAALYADPFNTTEMQNVLTEAINNEKTREKLIKNGHERVRDFSWNKTAEKTLKAYQKAIELKG